MFKTFVKTMILNSNNVWTRQSKQQQVSTMNQLMQTANHNTEDYHHTTDSNNKQT